ncbi:serine acetyltransferase [Mangrovimonas xylaniphaga]|uniref:serine acetyltransferase n=1 Tax=Mangrovimonas xylaniphaga TaxID=1645915 RepID=UPI000A46F63B|nr:serine acetyltransferase [Mangrovimonas xylaniphaga]
MRFLKRVIRRLLLPFLFKRYVVHNALIQSDVIQTLIVRGSKASSKPLRDQFNHVMLYYPEFAMIFFWRLKRRPWYHGLFTKDFHCKIFKSTPIDGGMMCYHPFATVINAKSIGKNFQFRNGLTIGNKANDNSLIPTIGNDVTVGSNVAIIGDISIGDHVIIGAGSVVVKDVPSNVVIAGNPAKIIRSLAHG